MVFTKVIRVLIAIPLIFLMILMVIINAKLVGRPEWEGIHEDTIHADLVKELKGLQSALNNDADVTMQNIYPEGYVFLNAIYALAWSSFLQEHRSNRFLTDGLSEMNKAWYKINSSEGRAPFSQALHLPYGSFYNGWSSYVLGSKLSLEQKEKRSKEEIEQFREQCAKIANAIREKTYPVSYSGGAWPADVMVCVASLALHDKLFESEYKGVIHDWISEVRKHVDSKGMIPHSVYPDDGTVKEDARGSSLALMLIFLKDIDPELAEEQFKFFKDNFVNTRLGLTGIREYAKGESGSGDVDSGPVILGFGGAASIVGMQTLSRYDEKELGITVRNAVEALAFGFNEQGERRFFLGLIPVADAFIAWSHANIKTSEKEYIFYWRFHIYSILFFETLAIFFWLLLSNRKQAV